MIVFPFEMSKTVLEQFRDLSLEASDDLALMAAILLAEDSLGSAALAATVAASFLTLLLDTLSFAATVALASAPHQLRCGHWAGNANRSAGGRCSKRRRRSRAPEKSAEGRTYLNPQNKDKPALLLRHCLVKRAQN
jgi:hypothetical protein